LLYEALEICFFDSASAQKPRTELVSLYVLSETPLGSQKTNPLAPQKQGKFAETAAGNTLAPISRVVEIVCHSSPDGHRDKLQQESMKKILDSASSAA